MKKIIMVLALSVLLEACESFAPPPAPLEKPITDKNSCVSKCFQSIFSNSGRDNCVLTCVKAYPPEDCKGVPK